MSKYLLSGGWGFGNLGDDAILLSTIELIKNVDAEAEIGVFSYDSSATKRLLCQYKKVKVFRSIQSILFGHEFELQFMVTQRTALQNFLLKLYYKWECVFFWLYRQDNCRHVRWLLLFSIRLQKIMQCYDYFCLAGGGYINDWRASLISKYIESLVAKHNSLKLITFGQSVGPFSSKLYQDIAEKLLSMYDTCSFRDINSYVYANYNQYIHRIVVPDYALYRSDSDNTYVSQTFISKLPIRYALFVVGYDNIENNIGFLSEYALYLNKKENLQIVFTVSQLWSTIETANCITKQLTDCGVSCTCIIPTSVHELEYLIKQSCLCLSQNLHALILAYKNQIPSFALNDRPKFKAFCDYTDIPIFSIINFNIDKAVKYTLRGKEGLIFKDFSATIENDFLFHM